MANNYESLSANDRVVDHNTIDALNDFLGDYPTWMNFAECYDADPEYIVNNPEEVIDKLCAHCPVAYQCAKFARDHGAKSLVFGGLMPVTQNTEE